MPDRSLIENPVVIGNDRRWKRLRARHLFQPLEAARFPPFVGVQNRLIDDGRLNHAVDNSFREADLLLVVGSDNSSNSNRLVEVARNLGRSSHLIENFRAIAPEWLDGVKTIALTAGASAPECLVEEVILFLQNKGFTNLREVEVMPENVRFGLPPEIVAAIGEAPAPAIAE